MGDGGGGGGHTRADDQFGGRVVDDYSGRGRCFWSGSWRTVCGCRLCFVVLFVYVNIFCSFLPLEFVFDSDYLFTRCFPRTNVLLDSICVCVIFCLPISSLLCVIF